MRMRQYGLLINTATLLLLQHCLGKLWDNLTE